jgi:RHS repeat-associated protein
VATYAYDGLTRRIHKGTDTQIQDYYYSKDWQVLEARGFETVTSSSSEPTVPDVTQFVWGLRGLDDLILRTQAIGEQTIQQLYALFDRWNVVAITNQTAAVQERYEYDAFGTPLFMTSSFNAMPNSSFAWETTFSSYRLDEETGFYQVRYRYLHPALGRWLSRDPMGEAEKKLGSNLYAYCNNNPNNLTDPDGRDPITVGIGIAITVAGLPLIPYAGGLAGAAGLTSLASMGLRAALADAALDSPLWAPTFNNLCATTTSLGGFLGRWTAALGVGITAAGLSGGSTSSSGNGFEPGGGSSGGGGASGSW